MNRGTAIDARAPGPPSNARLLAALPLLFAVAIGLQVLRDSGRRPFQPPPGMLWFRSGETVKRMALGYETVLADVYWMRAIVYYGGQRLATGEAPNYDRLYGLLDLVTSLDPRFTVAYRFGAIFLAEAYPSGPGRPDQAIALLERGVERTGRWEYMHDIGFVHYWWLRDYPGAATWFRRASQVPGAPAWLTPLAATTLAAGGDRQTSRQLWQQVLTGSDTVWLRGNAEYRLQQLDAMDMLDTLNAAAARAAARNVGVARSWRALGAELGLAGIPLDPAGVPFALDPSTGRVTLSADSPLLPLPDQLPAGPPMLPPRPES